MKESSLLGEISGIILVYVPTTQCSFSRVHNIKHVVPPFLVLVLFSVKSFPILSSRVFLEVLLPVSSLRSVTVSPLRLHTTIFWPLSTLHSLVDHPHPTSTLHLWEPPFPKGLSLAALLSPFLCTSVSSIVSFPSSTVLLYPWYVVYEHCLTVKVERTPGLS